MNPTSVGRNAGPSGGTERPRDEARDNGRWRTAPWILFAAAFVLYAAGITWGLPQATAPDRFEPWGSDELGPLGPLAQVYRVLLHGDARLDPRYPLLPYLIQAIFLAPYVLWLLVTGRLQGLSTEFPYGLADPVAGLAGMTVAARIPSLLLAAALPVIAFHTMRTFWDRRAASLAGIFVLLVYPLTYYARTSNVDAGSLFWTALGLLLFARCLRHGLSGRRAALLGLCAACGIATKDQNYAVFAALGIAIVALHVSAHRGQGARAMLESPLIGLGTAIAAYGLVSGLLLNPQAYLTHVRFVVFHPSGDIASGQGYYSTPATPRGYAALAVEYTRHLIDSLGWPTAVAAVGGLVTVGVRHPRLLLLALPVVAVLLGVIAPVRFVRIRFVLPAAYTLALFAAAGVSVFFTRRKQSLRGTPGLARAATVVVVGWALLRAVDLTYQMRNDSRETAAAWFRAHARPGDRVGYYGGPRKLPAFEAGIITQPGPFEMLAEAPSEWPEFIVVIPQQPFEVEHEWTLPAERYRELVAGAWDYDLLVATRTPSLFERRPMNWVNPPVRIFVRRDVTRRLGNPRPVLDLD